MEAARYGLPVNLNAPDLALCTLNLALDFAASDKATPPLMDRLNEIDRCIAQLTPAPISASTSENEGAEARVINDFSISTCPLAPAAHSEAS